MREIKFKGYSKTNNTWYYGLLGKFDGKYYIECEGGTKPFVEEDSIGQYTGFDDMNGEKIYEGDIVLAFKRSNKYKIVWSERHGAWGLECLDAEIIMPYLEGESYKVIGNIRGANDTNN